MHTMKRGLSLVHLACLHSILYLPLSLGRSIFASLLELFVCLFVLNCITLTAYCRKIKSLWFENNVQNSLGLVVCVVIHEIIRGPCATSLNRATIGIIKQLFGVTYKISDQCRMIYPA